MSFKTGFAITRKNAALRSLCLALALASAGASLDAPPAQAQTATPQDNASPADARQAKIAADRAAAFAAADKAQINGPADIKLKDQGVMSLPAGYSFIPETEARALLQAQGNSASKDTIGIFTSQGNDDAWWALLEFQPAGYVKDEAAKDWNAEELLTNITDGTESGNGSRIERGFKPIEVTGWIEKPAYDQATHRLVWSANVREKGVATDKGSVNYNTYALGRDGYFSLDLITGPDAIAKDKSAATTLLAAIAFAPGKGYADFNASTDHVAEYGIAALIGGVALKKLGLLALGAAFVLKFAKIIGLAVIGIGAVVARFFRAKKQNS